MRLTQSEQSSIIVDGSELPLRTDFRAALTAWDALQMAADGDLQPLAAAHIAISEMLGLDIAEMGMQSMDEALAGIGDYLNKYARSSLYDKTDNRPPLIDLEQDAIMLRDAFRLLNVDLFNDDITYPHFQSLMRLIATTDAAICRVIYLRQRNRDGKLTKDEKAEIRRVWGWETIRLRDKKADKAREDDENHFKQLQNKARLAKGLPPV